MIVLYRAEQRTIALHIAGDMDATEVAIKDVPAGLPFVIVASLPADLDAVSSASPAGYGEGPPFDLPEISITSDDVNSERQRRIVVGRVIDGVHVTGRDEDARNLMSLALIAQMRITAGDTTTSTTFRDGDNVDYDLTPPQVVTMWQASAAYVSSIYQASWNIKAMQPIPVDFADDSYWP